MKPPRQPVARWKLVAGIALHFLPLAYLATLLVAAAMGGIGPGLAQALSQALRLGGKFLAGYAATAGVATLLAASLDRMRPPPALSGDEAAGSRQALADALRQARSCFGAEGDTLCSELAGLPLNHGDPAVRRLVQELALLIDTTAPAVAAAPEVRNAGLAAMRSLVGEIREAAHADARNAALTMAHYVQSKYGRNTL